MGSSRGNCEIVEEKDVPTTSSQTFRLVRTQDRGFNQRPPISKKGPNKSLEDEINKLFEAVNLRTSKSLDFSDSTRNPTKRPIRGIGSHSPGGIEFSAPISLKQSLRGLCISQAAETAALKRLSMPSSPRISEFGKNTTLYHSVIGPVGPTSKNSPMKQSADSSPHFSASKDAANSPFVHTKDIEVDTQLVETMCLENSECRLASALPCHNAFDDVSKPDENVHVHNAFDDVSKPDKKVHVHNAFDDVSKPDEKVHVLNKVVASDDSTTHSKKSAPKLRKKLKQNVQSSVAVKNNKGSKNMVKPDVRKKPVVMKKAKKVVLSTGGNVRESREVNNSQLICQKCQCSLSDTVADVASKLVPSSTVKTKNASKSSEKGDISITQSTKSSDFSSSTTSHSVERNLISGTIFGNRPHMSKDMRWEAIEQIRKKYGFLGLRHFNLLKKLGSGDIGTVYLSELIGTNCVFAIKVMDIEFLARRKKMPRAKTEREVLRMLDHPFLPTLYAQFTSDNLSCLVMEFCPGGDLHVLRQKQPGRYFAEHAARFYVAEVLLALEYLHMLGIVYRDLKQENILVRKDGHIMLTDFDLSLRCSVSPILLKSSSLITDPPRVSGPCVGSNCIDPFCSGPSCKMSCFSPRLLPSAARARKLKAEATAHTRSLPQLVAEPTEARSNSFVGTHEYLAPEIIKGEGHGSAVDWWTFGVFLYELLYGKTPFKGADNDETLDNVFFRNLGFPSSPIVSFYARDLIRRLLVKEPEYRLGTETGAAEIKRHPFFDGMNWALIRCGVPPQVPEVCGVGNFEMGFQETGKKFM